MILLKCVRFLMLIFWMMNLMLLMCENLFIVFMKVLILLRVKLMFKLRKMKIMKIIIVFFFLCLSFVIVVFDGIDFIVFEGYDDVCEFKEFLFVG